MMRPAVAAWALAGLAVVLLVGSLTGTGEGLFGTGFLRSPAWSWALLLGGAALMLALLLRRAPGDEPAV